MTLKLVSDQDNESTVYTYLSIEHGCAAQL